ncbi:mitochondrial outer membrane translocase complex, subunit Tom20 domain-containing protein [Lineolata rhizophorae]|uniref:Mitochondrial outer membrane translocase complex, subunit Tom20 domain-containing protein n=1 Tax=Lineolata rhizophorae TaxID=578093 RepID=A0A6A6P5Q2_9PEZI|nr:mitochondrial outer membrane translocase complex, subunit Tom20 domain-containing protein [Lineolata rhizophorae]
MASTEPALRTSTIVAACVGTALTGVVAYALYFDYRRRSDPEFRRALKKASKRQEKAAKEAAEAEEKEMRTRIKAAIATATAETDPIIRSGSQDEHEAFFMQEVAKGEALCQDGSDPVDAALSLFKALKVYPSPSDLINIYDRTVTKPVLDVLAQMIAADPSIKVTARRPGSDDGANVE